VITAEQPFSVIHPILEAIMSDISNTATKDLQSPSPSNGDSGRASPSKGIGAQAAEAARDLRDRATHTAREVVAGAESKLRTTAEEQKVAGAEHVSAIAGAISRTADELETELPQAARYVRGAATEIQNLSDAVRQRDLNVLLRDVQDLARRQPAAFLGVSVLAGFAAIRFLKTTSQSVSGGGTNKDSRFGAQKEEGSATLSEYRAGAAKTSELPTSGQATGVGTLQGNNAGGLSTPELQGRPQEAPGFSREPTRFEQGSP
jgi:hypothetical protein